MGDFSVFVLYFMHFTPVEDNAINVSSFYFSVCVLSRDLFLFLVCFSQHANIIDLAANHACLVFLCTFYISNLVMSDKVVA